VRLGGWLKAEQGFGSVAPVSVAAGQEVGFGDPRTVFTTVRRRKVTVRFFTYSIRGDSLHRFNASLAAEASRPP
jgi:hypothetical protein